MTMIRNQTPDPNPKSRLKCRPQPQVETQMLTHGSTWNLIPDSNPNDARLPTRDLIPNPYQGLESQPLLLLDLDLRSDFNLD